MPVISSNIHNHNFEGEIREHGEGEPVAARFAVVVMHARHGGPRQKTQSHSSLEGGLVLRGRRRMRVKRRHTRAARRGPILSRALSLVFRTC